jgi:hypothetical protein
LVEVTTLDLASLMPTSCNAVTSVGHLRLLNHRELVTQRASVVVLSRTPDANARHCAAVEQRSLRKLLGPKDAKAFVNLKENLWESSMH